MKNFEKMTNEEFIMNCMNFSKYGPLGQIALLQCLKAGIDKFQQDEKANLEYEKKLEQEGKISLISYKSFHDAVNELAEKYDLMYEENPS